MSIVYVLAKFPHITETFISNEIMELESRGIAVTILAVEQGTIHQTGTNGAHRWNVYYLADINILKAHIYAVLNFRKEYFIQLKESLLAERSGLPDLLKNIRTFSRSVRFLYRIRSLPAHLIHAHFISMPADIAMKMSLISGIPFSCSAHAHDIYTAARRSLTGKIKASRFVLTCTEYNKNYLQEIAGTEHAEKIKHIYHGIDTDCWPRRITGSRISKAGQIRILSVARLVEKKGIWFLLQALSGMLKQGWKLKCTLIGEGDLTEEFENYVRRNHLQNIVQFLGEQGQDKIKTEYGAADLFVLPCIIASNGDRDGLPNVLLEALATGLPVITTAVSAIPELVSHEITGLIVAQNDAESIQQAIVRLSEDSLLYRSVSENGRAKIEKDFNIQHSTDSLLGIFNKYNPA